MNITASAEILPLYILLLALVPVISVVLLYIRLWKRAEFKRSGQAKLEITRALFSLCIALLIILQGIFGFIASLWFIPSYILLLVGLYLIERAIRKKHGITE